MASRSIINYDSTSFDTMDKMPTNTLKRNTKNIDMTKAELLRLLSFLEGELQGREVTIAALKAEKSKQLLYQAKYGRFGLGDPFHALQRDSDSQRDSSFDEAAVKAMYDNQLTQLENLIETQRGAQTRMREQLAAVEKRYHKVCAELEEEKRRHAKDAEEGDNVTCLLEKERERLKQELDFEKAQNKKLEKELKKTNACSEEGKTAADKHKLVAVKLIRERNILVEKIIMLDQRNKQLEKTLQDEQDKTKEMAEGIAQESQKCHQLEANLEKALSDFDTEREQLKLKLSREENKNKELTVEVEKLKFQIEQLQRQVGQEKRLDSPKTIQIKSSPHVGSSNGSVSSAPMHRVTSPPPSAGSVSPRGQPTTASKVFKSANPASPDVRQVPVLHVRNSPDGEVSAPLIQKPQVSPNAPAKRTLKSSFDNTATTAKPTIEQLNDRGTVSVSNVSKPIPAEKPAELQGSKVNVASTGTSVLSMSGGTTVFTTPSGTRISLNVGPSNAAVGNRKPSSSGGGSTSNTTRGAPPPVPPNKPQVIIPPSPQSPRNLSPGIRPPTGGVPVPVHHQTSSRLSPRFVNSPFAGPRPTQQPESVRKAPPPQGDVHQMTKHNGHTSCDQAHDPSLEFLEPEIEDLQQILVSMATVVLNPRNWCEYHNMTKAHSASESTSFSEPEEPSQSVVQVGEALVASVNSSSSIQNNQEISSNEKGPYKVLANQISEVDSKIILQKYVDGCDWLGLQEYLSSHKDTDMELQLNNGNTIGHSVAEQGQLDCLRLVLNLGLNVNSVNGLGMTILHSAVTGHQLGCVKLLLEFGADMSLKTKEHMSCLHLAAKLGFSQIFCLLLEQCLNNWPQQVTNLLQECDLGGNSVVFLAAMNTHVEMLEFISKCCEIDVKHVNRNGKTILDVASFGCLSLLQSLEKEKISCNVVVDTGPSSVNSTPSESGNNQWFVVGSISVAKDTSWQQIESLLSNVLLNHLTEVHQGLRTKKTVVKTDAESPDSQNVHFSLGVSLNSVKYFGIGIYFWSPGTPSERRPFDLLSNTQNKQITVRLFGTDDGCLDNLSYESLIPHQQLQNYLRLMEQYKSVILYGATGSGKTFLCRKLAQIIQSKEGQLGRVSELNFVSVHDKFTKNDLHSVLHKTGCLLHCTQSMSQNYTSMVILDGLEKCNVADLFSDIAGIIDCRGPAATLPLAFDNKPSQNYYLHSNCFILGTMDTLRLPVMELSIQQSFRWVQFRNDQEPMRYLLHRQLYRQLLHQYRGTMPSPEEPVFKAVEWIISVWHRLNEGIMKLALQDHILGPAAFLSCPIEIGMPKTILRWLNMLWNQKIAPAVSDAVVKGSGSDTVAGGQQKVANTALYVLMQRSIVSGCPLVGQEKERYMSGFQGSNELDIRMRKERIKTSQPSTPTSETKVDIEADLDLIKHGSDTTGWTDSGHSPDIHSPHGKQGFYNTGRNPLQKSASLPSNNIGQHSPRAAGTPMSPQLNRSGLSPHPQPFTLSPKVVNTTEPPKSFGSSMFALSGVPVSKQEQVRNNVRSNSVSATSSPQFSRTILAGSPLPNQSGSRSATQSPAFQGGQLSLPTHSHSISSPEILANNNLVGNARLGPSDNRSVSSQKTGNHIMQQYPLSPTLQNSFNTSLPQSKTNKNLRAQTMSPVSKFISGPNLTAHQQTVLQGGVNVGNGTNSAKGLDTSNLRRAFSPTPQQFPGRGDLQKPDVLRRSFSPSPDMLFSRRTGDQGVLPLTLPKK